MATYAGPDGTQLLRQVAVNRNLNIELCRTIRRCFSAASFNMWRS